MRDIHLATLANGVTVVTAPMPTVRSVSVVLTFRTGARYESATETGMSHFIEHMLFKGTARYPTARLLSEAIENVGGDLNGSTGKETTEYSVRLSGEHADRAFDVLTELARAPRFTPEDLEKERRVIIEELGMYKDTPQDWVQVLADELIFPDQPLGREVIGTPTTLGAITREGMRAFYAAHYVPAALVVSVAGNISHADALAAAGERFGDWDGGPAPTFAPATPSAGGERVTVLRRATEQANLCLALPGLGQDDPDHDALTILNAILGEGMSSRLFQTIREDRGLVYDIASAAASFAETGILTISAGCEPERASDVLRGVMVELGRLRDAPPAEGEVRRIKDFLRGRLAISMEDSGSVAGWLGAQVAQRGRYRSIEELLARIETVTVAQVHALAQRLLRPESLRLAAIGPLPKASHFAPLLTF